MKTILISGGKGKFAKALIQANKKYKIYAPSKNQMNILSQSSISKYMSKKKLLAINLNEFNLDFLKYGANKYNCPNIKKLLKFKKIKTYSIDKVQDKNC